MYVNIRTHPEFRWVGEGGMWIATALLDSLTLHCHNTDDW